MRRLIAGLACVAVAALTAPAAATAAHARSNTVGPNPVNALRKQFAANGGVKYRSSTKLKNQLVATTTGSFRFGRSGVVASTLTTRIRVDPADLSENPLLAALPERTIKIGDTTYINSGVLRSELPPGRPWVEVNKGPATGLLGVFGQLINPTEPATLKTLLAAGRSKRPGGVVDGSKTTVYSGTVTIARLYKVSPWLRGALLVKPDAKLARTKLDWRLYVGADGLPRRVVSSWSPAALGAGKAKLSTDSRFTSWGTKVSIKPPADDEIIQIGETEAELTSPILTSK
ncbi:hypothetical protein AB0K60_34765 [Thermopolyspora sp. NPDC052614]|uniref:hypothetical protein n=1 Tax=Thermopolyspora sp. NPDC052614 TaxID=3155682 RepID=UPI00343C792D